MFLSSQGVRRHNSDLAATGTYSANHSISQEQTRNIMPMNLIHYKKKVRMCLYWIIFTMSLQQWKWGIWHPLREAFATKNWNVKRPSCLTHTGPPLITNANLESNLKSPCSETCHELLLLKWIITGLVLFWKRWKGPHLQMNFIIHNLAIKTYLWVLQH